MRQLVEHRRVAGALLGKSQPGGVAIADCVAGSPQPLDGGIELEALHTWFSARLQVQEMAQVLNQVPSHLVGQLCHPPRALVESGDHQSRGVEDSPERADPGFVVVTGAEEIEDGIREVALQHLRRPHAPIDEDPFQLTRYVEQFAGLEQRHTRRRRPGAGIERDDQSLALLKRREKGEEKADRECHRAQSGGGFHQHQGARRGPDSHDWTEAKGEQ